MTTATLETKAPPARKPSAKAAQRPPGNPVNEVLHGVASQIAILLQLDETALGTNYCKRVLRQVDAAIGEYLAWPLLSPDDSYDSIFDIIGMMMGARDMEDGGTQTREIMAAAVTMLEAAVATTDAGPEPEHEAEPATAITAETLLQHGGKVAMDMLRHATFEIDGLAATISAAPDVSADDGGAGYMIRVAALRIRELNSYLMSSVSDDGVTLAYAAAKIYPLDGEDQLADLIEEHAGEQQ